MLSKRNIKNAAKWSILEAFASTLLTASTILFLARILSPDDYGQIATAQLISAFIQLILTIGITEAVIQKKELSQDYITTAHKGMLLTGITGAIICLIISYIFYQLNKYTISTILIIEAINIFLIMIIVVPSALLIRNLEMKVLTKRTIISKLMFFIIAIPLALNNYGLWSVVIATLVQNMTSAFLILIKTSDKIDLKYKFEKEKFKQLIGFGSYVMLENLLWSVLNKVFGLLIALFHGASALGLYNMATKFTDAILSILNMIITRMALPIFSSVQDSKEKLLNAFQTTTFYFNLISMPLFVFIAFTSELWVPLVMGNQWIELIPIIKIVSVMYAIMYSRVCVGVAVKAVGKSKEFLVLSLTAAVITIMASILTQNLSLIYTLYALAIPRILITIPLGTYLLKKICGFSIKDQFKPVFYPIIFSFVILICLYFINMLLLSNSDLVILLVQMLTSLILFIFFLTYLIKANKLNFKL